MDAGTASRDFLVVANTDTVEGRACHAMCRLYLPEANTTFVHWTPTHREEVTTWLYSDLGRKYGDCWSLWFGVAPDDDVVVSLMHTNVCAFVAGCWPEDVRKKLEDFAEANMVSLPDKHTHQSGLYHAWSLAKTAKPGVSEQLFTEPNFNTGIVRDINRSVTHSEHGRAAPYSHMTVLELMRAFSTDLWHR